MSDYPYATVPGKIPFLFQTIGEKGVPPKVTIKWLEQYGMGSSNDRRLISILKHLNFIEPSGTPTTVWNEYRGPKSREVMSAALRRSYSDLY